MQVWGGRLRSIQESGARHQWSLYSLPAQMTPVLQHGQSGLSVVVHWLVEQFGNCYCCCWLWTAAEQPGSAGLSGNNAVNQSNNENLPMSTRQNFSFWSNRSNTHLWPYISTSVSHRQTWSVGTPVRLASSRLLVGFSSSLGTISMRKSNWSYLEMAIAISFLWKYQGMSQIIINHNMTDIYMIKINSHNSILFCSSCLVPVIITDQKALVLQLLVWKQTLNSKNKDKLSWNCFFECLVVVWGGGEALFHLF